MISLGPPSFLSHWSSLDLSPLWLSLRSASLAVLLVAPLGVYSAQQVRLWHGVKRTATDLLLLSPLVLPPTVLGFILLQLLGRHGPIGGPLHQIGIEIVFTWQATVLSSAVCAFPLMYRSALAAFDQIDDSLPQVARSLGASEWRVMRVITLPLALPGLVAGISLSFARALGEFGTTLMLAGNIPGRTQTLPLAIFSAVDAGDTSRAWFWTIFVLALNGISLLLMQRLERRGNGQRFLRQQGSSSHRLGGQLAQIPLIPGPPHPAVVKNKPFHLSVLLERQLADFCLQLNFETSCGHLGILGASGAGKSQLLRCLAGLGVPNRGYIKLNGRLLFDSKTALNVPLQQRRMGLVFQHYALFPHLNVLENVGFGLAHLSVIERRQRVANQLSRVGLLAMAHHFPRQLSGGQQQRVALARALAIEPEILLLDEPFSAQDTYLRRQLQQQMADLLNDCAVPVLLVTHDLEEAYRLCDDLMLLDRGQVLAHGPKHAVFDNPQQLMVARISGCKNFSLLWRLPDPTQLWALDWQLQISVEVPPAPEFTQVGIRANHLRLSPGPANFNQLGPNQWLCELQKFSEGPHRVSVYVIAGQQSENQVANLDCNQQPSPIQVEIRRDDWFELRQYPQPWLLSVPGERLMFLRDAITG
jgi:molybdate transport system permease protein